MNTSSLKHTLPQAYDRVAQLKAFEETKTGVKGVVDSGILNVPPIFIRPSDELADEQNYTKSNLQAPVIDLTGIKDNGQRDKIITDVKKASREWGFFQVVNHGISIDVLDKMLDGIRRFHEQDVEKKKEFYYRDDTMQKVKYASNVDLYRSRAANWRDSLTVTLLRGEGIEPNELPEVCRDSTINYINQVTKLAETLFELLSEALGLKADHLGGLECARGRNFIGHYYPACPEPELTMGTSKHTDPTNLTILLQDQIGGLQFMHDNQYVDVHPLAGSLVVNIGDMLQIISNDEFISPDHRVLANRVGPRISVAGFFTGTVATGKIYAPIEELISEKNPPKYKEFTVRDYISKFFMRPIDKSGLDEFRLQE